MVANTKIASNATKRPPVFIDAAHFDRLQGLALGAMDRSPDVAEQLLDEIERADRLPSDQMPRNVVNIGSQVTFRDEGNGRTQTVELVFPGEADISQGRISVLTPIGAALIGLSEGDAMAWEGRDAEIRRLTVLKVG